MSVYSWVSPAMASGRIADLLEEFEMAVGVARLALGGRAEHHGDVVVALHIGLLGEVEIAAVSLGFSGESGLQIFFCPASLE